MMDALKALRDPPQDVARAASLIAQLDGCFLLGFGRLGDAQLQALAALARVLSGSPLGASAAAAVEAVRRSEFTERHLVALACARAALQGAQHDALAAQAAAVLGRGPAAAPPASATAAAPSPAHGVFLESTRHFLMELALAGFLQLSPESLAPFYATLEKIQAEPALIRLSALLTGFLGELTAALPVRGAEHVPLHRFVDLWSRAMVLSIAPPAPPAVTTVSGDFLPLGVDLHHHPNLISATVYGVLAEAGAARLVRATVSAYKVDVVMGSEAWKLFGAGEEKLLAALSGGRALRLDGMTLLGGGDLFWDEARASLGAETRPLETAAAHAAPGQALARVAQAGVDRHPVQLAEPVFLRAAGGFALRPIPETAPVAAGKNKPSSAEELEGLGIDLGGGVLLPIAGRRLSATTELTAQRLGKASALLGLLRFDRGRWAIQPLAIDDAGRPGQALFIGGPAAGGGGKSKADTVAILRERAGKLLRAK